MINRVILTRVIVVVFSTAMTTNTGIAYAFDMCNKMFDMMNKSKNNQSEWSGDAIDRDDYYGDTGVNSVYGYRGRGYSYGTTSYGYGGPPVPSYGYTGPVYAVPHPEYDALQAEIYQLKLQIKSLEKALIHESSRPQSALTNPGTG